jgi:hypothetical protein
MKKKIILLIASSLLILSCEQNLCDKGYKPHKQNGQTIYSWLLNGKYLILNLEILIIENMAS